MSIKNTKPNERLFIRQNMLHVRRYSKTLVCNDSSKMLLLLLLPTYNGSF